MKQAPVKTCPKCGGKVERLIGAGAGLIFKGSGFYITDYKKQPVAASGQSTGGSVQKTKGRGQDTGNGDKEKPEKIKTKPPK